MLPRYLRQKKKVTTSFEHQFIAKLDEFLLKIIRNSSLSDLIRLIQPDLENFDPRIWIIAVGIVLGTLTLLAIGLCVVLSRECYQSSAHRAGKSNSQAMNMETLNRNSELCLSSPHTFNSNTFLV